MQDKEFERLFIDKMKHELLLDDSYLKSVKNKIKERINTEPQSNPYMHKSYSKYKNSTVCKASGIAAAVFILAAGFANFNKIAPFISVGIKPQSSAESSENNTSSKRSLESSIGTFIPYSSSAISSSKASSVMRSKSKTNSASPSKSSSKLSSAYSPGSSVSASSSQTTSAASSSSASAVRAINTYIYDADELDLAIEKGGEKLLMPKYTSNIDLIKILLKKSEDGSASELIYTNIQYKSGIQNIYFQAYYDGSVKLSDYSATYDKFELNNKTAYKLQTNGSCKIAFEKDNIVFYISFYNIDYDEVLKICMSI